MKHKITNHLAELKLALIGSSASKTFCLDMIYIHDLMQCSKYSNNFMQCALHTQMVILDAPLLLQLLN